MPIPWLALLQALPAVAGGAQALFNRPQPMPQMMNWDQAMQAAQAQMQPALQQYDNQTMQRGFYGQIPTDAYRNSWAAGQQTQLAQQMMQQQANWQLQQGQLNQDIRNSNMNTLLNGLNTSWGLMKGYSDLTGRLPWDTNKQTAGMQAATAATVLPTALEGAGGLTPGMDALTNGARAQKSILFQNPYAPGPR